MMNKNKKLFLILTVWCKVIRLTVPMVPNKWKTMICKTDVVKTKAAQLLPGTTKI
jgi:hypothetical protein